MLPKKHRLMLRHTPDFFVKSKKVHSPLFTIFYLSTEHAISQGAVVVPKKQIPLATGRNKMKRVVSELLSPLLKEKQHLAVTVLVKKPLTREDLTVLSQMLNQL